MDLENFAFERMDERMLVSPAQTVLCSGGEYK
jgi:hypothetical protein